MENENVKIECKDVMSNICENLGEDTGSEKCRTIKKHIEECQSCREYLSSVKITIECYKNYNVELPENAHERLMNFLGKRTL